MSQVPQKKRPWSLLGSSHGSKSISGSHSQILQDDESGSPLGNEGSRLKSRSLSQVPQNGSLLGNEGSRLKSRSPSQIPQNGSSLGYEGSRLKSRSQSQVPHIDECGSLLGNEGSNSRLRNHSHDPPGTNDMKKQQLPKFGLPVRGKEELDSEAEIERKRATLAFVYKEATV